MKMLPKSIRWITFGLDVTEPVVVGSNIRVTMRTMQKPSCLDHNVERPTRMLKGEKNMNVRKSVRTCRASMKSSTNEIVS